MKKKICKKYGWILIWGLVSIVFAAVLQFLFSLEAPIPFLQAKWSAGDILTYSSTILLGLLALWQNQRFKNENDATQEKLEALSTRANELQITSKLIEHEAERINLLRTQFQTFFDVQQGMTPTTIWKCDDVGHNQEGRQELKKLFDDKGYFDSPKPQRLMHRILKVANLLDNSIVLDFFSGSASTAHAVMQLNAEDGGHRKFIMVQLPEKCDEKSEAYKAGYKNICEIGKERIRRAGAKIKEEAGLAAQNLDTGFRVLKCDTSNMKDVYYNPAEYEVNMFSRLEDNIKEDRTPEDLLFQVMLDLGVLLSSKIEETTIAGKKVFNVEDNYLIACFDSDVSEETIKAIAKQKPYYFVMRDSSMASDSVATNFDQIFATYSPDTVRKVL